MQRGDLVIVTNDPLLWGVGTIRHVRSDGMIAVDFPDGTIEAFDPQELANAEAWDKVA